MTQVVHNVDMQPKAVSLRCNWCSGEFTYREDGGRYARRTNCPWCQKSVHIPRERLRRLSKSGVIR